MRIGITDLEEGETKMTQTTGIYGPDTFTVTSLHGNVVDAKYLKAPDGACIIDPLTKAPYIVPADYDPVAALALIKFDII